MGVSLNGDTPKTPPKGAFLVGTPILVGYHHFRKPPYGGPWGTPRARLGVSCRDFLFPPGVIRFKVLFSEVPGHIPYRSSHIVPWKGMKILIPFPWNEQFAPENRPLEKEIPIGNHHFYLGSMLVLGSVDGCANECGWLQFVKWRGLRKMLLAGRILHKLMYCYERSFMSCNVYPSWQVCRILSLNHIPIDVVQIHGCVWPIMSKSGMVWRGSATKMSDMFTAWFWCQESS